MVGWTTHGAYAEGRTRPNRAWCCWSMVAVDAAGCAYANFREANRVLRWSAECGDVHVVHGGGAADHAAVACATAF